MHLPAEILQLVYKELDAQSLCSAAQACSWFKCVVDCNDALWRNLAISKNFVHASDELSGFNSWRELYREKHLEEMRWAGNTFDSVKSYSELQTARKRVQASEFGAPATPVHMTAEQWGRILLSKKI